MTTKTPKEKDKQKELWEAVKGFDGDHRFLSNFYPSPVVFLGKTYSTVEHAYQAAKSPVVSEREQIRKEPSAGRVKRMGRKVTLRKDWENVKLSVMRFFVLQKFSEPGLRDLLLATGDSLLEETNSWGDTYWGVCEGVGQNHLGKILMSVRKELRQKLHKKSQP